MGLPRSALRLPEEADSPGLAQAQHLIALPLRQQPCCRPKRLADRFDRSHWKRGAPRTLSVAQLQPAARAEPFRRSFEATQVGRALRIERGRGIRAGRLAPSRSNRRAALDRSLFWSRLRRQAGPPECTIPIWTRCRRRAAPARSCSRDITQQSPVGSPSRTSALFACSRSIKPVLGCLEPLQARSACRKNDVLPFRIKARRAQPVDVAEKLVDKSRHAAITR